MAVAREKTDVMRVVVEPAMKGFFVFVLVGVIFSMLAGFIWYRSNMIKLANEVHQLRKDHLQVTQDLDEARATILQLENYPRILKVAKAKLDLIPAPEKPELIPVPRSNYQVLHDQGLGE